MPPITRDRSAAIADDVRRGPYPRLTPAAIERAKVQLGTDRLETLFKQLGFSEMTFWRVRRGQFDIRYLHALRVAKRINWPIERCFEVDADV